MGKSKSAKSVETKKKIKAKIEKTPEQQAADTAYISERRRLGKSVREGQDELVDLFGNISMAKGKGKKSKRRRRRRGTRKK